MMIKLIMIKVGKDEEVVLLKMIKFGRGGERHCGAFNFGYEVLRPFEFF